VDPLNEWADDLTEEGRTLEREGENYQNSKMKSHHVSLKQIVEGIEIGKR
jgi:hypothetical protein